MKKKCFILALLICSALWVWQYAAVNTYYNREFPELRLERFSLGEDVNLLANSVDGGANVEGYSVRVDHLDILTQAEVMQRWPESQLITYQASDRLALVSITLSNTVSNGGIMLTDFLLCTQDVPTSMDYDLLSIMNPILAGNYGIILPYNAECQLILPFRLIASLFRASAWEHIDQYMFFLRVNDTQAVKEIQIGVSNVDSLTSNPSTKIEQSSK